MITNNAMKGIREDLSSLSLEFGIWSLVIILFIMPVTYNMLRMFTEI